MGIYLPLEGLHPLYHKIDGGDSFVRRGSSELCSLGCFVQTGCDGLGFLVDSSLCGFEVATDEFKRHFEERCVEDELIIGNKFCRISHRLALPDTIMDYSPSPAIGGAAYVVLWLTLSLLSRVEVKSR